MDPMDESLSSVCDDCERDFHFYGLLEKHRIDVHEEEEVLYCGVCNTAFKRKMNLVLHWRSTAHRSIRLIGCDICDAFNVSNGFPTEEGLAEHTAQVHGEGVVINAKEQEDYYCPLCQKKFSHRKGMIEHLQVLHGEHLFGDLLGEKGTAKQQLLNKLLFRCEDCDKSFRVKSTLNRHREKFHNDYSHWSKNPNRGNPPPQAFVVGGEQPQDSPAVRGGGGGGSGLISSLGSSSSSSSHATVVRPSGGGLGSQETLCPYCQKTFTRPSVLNVHMEMVHSKLLEEDKHKQVVKQDDDSVDDDDEFGEVEEVDGEGEDEEGDDEEEVIEIAPDFYHDSSEEADGEDPGVDSSPLLRMTLSKALQKPRPQPLAQQQYPKQFRQQQHGLSRPTMNFNASSKHLHHQRPQNRPSLLPSSVTVTRTKNASHISGVTTAATGKGTVPKRTAGGSSSEDEGLPKTANVIVKHSASLDYADEDWTAGGKRSKIKRVSVGEDGGVLRSSTRIRTKRRRTSDSAAAATADSTGAKEGELDEDESESKDSAEKAEEDEETKGVDADSSSTSSASAIGASTSDDSKPPRETQQPSAVSPVPKAPMELVEECVENCGRKFYGYFSMMRHVAFTHHREKTISLMKLLPSPPPTPQESRKMISNPLLRNDCKSFESGLELE